MDNYFAEFQQLLNEYKFDQNLKTLLLECIETVTQHVKEHQNTICLLENEIKTLTGVETFGISARYSSLKEAHAQLQVINVNLRNENDELKIKILAREQELKQEFQDKLELIENEFKNKLTEKQTDLNLAESEYNKKIQDLLNEATMSGAASSMEFQRIEEKHKKEVLELTQKIKESNDTSNTLRNELRKKNQVVAELCQKITTLEKRNSRNLSSAFQEQNYSESYNENSFEDEQSTFEIEDSIDAPSNSLQSKYRPLEVVNKNAPSPQNLSIHNRKTPVYRSSLQNNIETVKKRKNYVRTRVPPLMDITIPKPKQDSLPRKRKLYNPEDLTYLEESG